jgi:hypothetical protein
MIGWEMTHPNQMTTQVHQAVPMNQTTLRTLKQLLQIQKRKSPTLKNEVGDEHIIANIMRAIILNDTAPIDKNGDIHCGDNKLFGVKQTKYLRLPGPVPGQGVA